MTDFLETCKAKALEIGVVLDSPSDDGVLRRCGTIDKPRSKNGVAVIYGDEPRSGWFKNWSTGEEAILTVKSTKTFTPAERKTYTQRMTEQKAQREVDTEKRHAEAGRKAQYIWDNAVPAEETHLYLQKKGIPPLGTRLGRNNCLVVPVLGEKGATQSLQFIEEDGSKRFLTGGRTKGGFFSIPAKHGRTDDTLCIGEGYATMGSVHLATDMPVLWRSGQAT